MSEKLSIATGPWRVTETVDSQWAGTVQIKWNSATGQSFHSVGYGGRQVTWLGALRHLAWTPIANPVDGWKDGPCVPNRFIVRPHVIFGDSRSYDRERAAVFLIDTYSGTSYVASMEHNGTKNFFYHDEVRGATWVQIEEAMDLPTPPFNEVNRYEISAVNSTYALQGIGRLGPYVTRLDTHTGRVDIAIQKALLSGSEDADVVQFIWYPISTNDPGPN